jgi:hypothetical protein
MHCWGNMCFRVLCVSSAVQSVTPCNFSKDQYKPPEDGPRGTETCRGEYMDVLTVNFSILCVQRIVHPLVKVILILSRCTVQQ